ncbi:unnamed protein product [Protopolystoma xenopodis]|uniref:Uncharacterized protein n=1 Tax=Protopolystoma xenopodis TaxID=117903 RepID=A0A448WQG1_9PLAT|nr:unnamed protein product [Protopolystoma xenopodis]
MTTGRSTYRSLAVAHSSLTLETSGDIASHEIKHRHTFHQRLGNLRVRLHRRNSPDLSSNQPPGRKPCPASSVPSLAPYRSPENTSTL